MFFSEEKCSFFSKTLVFLQKLKKMLVIKIFKYSIIFPKLKEMTDFFGSPLSRIAEIRSKGKAC